MAKARITTSGGLSIQVEGTPSEITALVNSLHSGGQPQPERRSRTAPRSGRVLLSDVIASLIDGNFFKQPRDLAAIKTALAEMGHHYPVTTLSPVMLRLVRRRVLRRIRQNKRWMYTG
jgi:hypothetical protein